MWVLYTVFDTEGGKQFKKMVKVGSHLISL